MPSRGFEGANFTMSKATFNFCCRILAASLIVCSAFCTTAMTEAALLASAGIFILSLYLFNNSTATK